MLLYCWKLERISFTNQVLYSLPCHIILCAISLMYTYCCFSSHLWFSRCFHWFFLLTNKLFLFIIFILAAVIRQFGLFVNSLNPRMAAYTQSWKLLLMIKIIFLLVSFSYQRFLIVFYWSLSNGNYPLAYRTPLSILVVIKNVAIWIVLIRLLISNSSCAISKPLEIVPSEPVGITTTLMFYCFLRCLANSKNMSLFSISLIFILTFAETAKSTWW